MSRRQNFWLRTVALALAVALAAGCAKPNRTEEPVPMADVDAAIRKAAARLLALRNSEGYWDGSALFYDPPHDADTIGLNGVYLSLLQRLDPGSKARAGVAAYLVNNQVEGGGWGNPAADWAGLLALEGERASPALLESLKRRVAAHGQAPVPFHVAASYALANRPLPVSRLSQPVDLNKPLTPWEQDLGIAFAILVQAAERQRTAVPMTAEQEKRLKGMVWQLLDLQMPDGSWSASAFQTVVALQALTAVGYGADTPAVLRALRFLERMQAPDGSIIPLKERVCYTAVSLWVLQEAGQLPQADGAKATEWLLSRQWASGAWDTPGVSPRLQDYDCTAFAAISISKQHRLAAERATAFVREHQHSDGGWGTFSWAMGERPGQAPLRWFPNTWEDVLHEDPSTVDMTAHALLLLGRMGYKADDPVVANAVSYLQQVQFEDGKWFAYWTLPYLYGTSQALLALQSVRIDMKQPWVQKGAQWLKSRQNADGGWGEDRRSLQGPEQAGLGESTAVQTAWALSGLLAAGEPASSPAVVNGVKYLLKHQQPDGSFGRARVWISIGDTRFALEGDEVSWAILALHQYRVARGL